MQHINNAITYDITNHPLSGLTLYQYHFANAYVDEVKMATVEFENYMNSLIDNY